MDEGYWYGGRSRRKELITWQVSTKGRSEIDKGILGHVYVMEVKWRGGEMQRQEGEKAG